MTEQEIIDDAMKAVPDYLATIRATGEFDLDRCVERELRRVEVLFRKHRGLSTYAPLGRKEQDTLEGVLAHFTPALRERTKPVMLRYLKGRRVSAIGAAAAGALVTGALGAAGMQGEVTPQRHRARVDVSLLPDTTLRFYVRYRDLGREGLMDGLLQAAMDLRDALLRLGPGSTIKRI